VLVVECQLVEESYSLVDKLALVFLVLSIQLVVEFYSLVGLLALASCF